MTLVYNNLKILNFTKYQWHIFCLNILNVDFSDFKCFFVVLLNVQPYNNDNNNIVRVR